MKKINLYISNTFLILTAVFGLSACHSETDTENWGYVSKFSKISEVVPNQSTREEVTEKLGSPTSKSVYGDEKWFYIGSEVTRESFFTPEVVSHEVYTITFNKEGIVTGINKKGKEAMNEVQVSKEETTTEGNEVTLGQQFLGNLGKFNKEGLVSGGKRDSAGTRLPRY